MKKDRNQNGIPIKEALEGYYKALGVDGKMHETRVLAQWEQLMGEAVAARTEGKYIKEGVLFLEMSSSVMRAELQQNKQAIVNKINACAGYDLIKDVFLK